MADADKAQQEAILQGFSQRLRRLRKARKLRQFDMEEMGLSYKYYQRLESGHANPTLLTLYKIASALEVSPREFFCSETDRQSDVS